MNIRRGNIMILFLISSSLALTDDALENVLKEANVKLGELYNREVQANYDYEINQLDADLTESDYARNSVIEYVKDIKKQIQNFNLDTLQNENIKRQISRLPKIDYNILNDADLEELVNSIFKMSEIYKTVKLCSYKEPAKCNLLLIPDIQDILHSTNDVKEIEYYWTEWRKTTGISVKESFNKFVQLYRKSAELNNFKSPSQMWYDNFDDANIIDKLDSVMSAIRPLFNEFHGRARYLLKQKYGSEIIKSSLPYPQHLSEIFIGESFRYDEFGAHIDFPYPEKALPNITQMLIDQNYTAEEFFDLASKFFPSIGMDEVPKSLWTDNALPIAHPERIVLNCWNKAWHFYGIDKVKLSHCTNVDFRQFLNMYEVLSDVQYYQQFRNQPTVFQDEPLPNFSDAIGRVISMSASTPKYLEKIGILQPGTFDKETRLNRLYLEGMQKIFLLPVLYILDKYRIQVLENKTPLWDNCAFWELTQKYTGSVPPTKRSNNDFDAPSKLLVGVDDKYSSQIISIILQFQIYKHFCEITGEYKKGNDEYPLDNCDLSDHHEIGDVLKKAMSLGASKSWKEVLEVLTGENDLNPSGFIEYFQKLFDWLIEQNRKNEAEVGWEEVKQCE